jgi:hypothetical protein
VAQPDQHLEFLQIAPQLKETRGPIPLWLASMICARISRLRLRNSLPGEYSR